MTGVLIKGGNLDTESGMHPGKMPYEDEGRDGVMPVQAMECQGVPAIYQNLPLLRERPGPCSLTALRRDNPMTAQSETSVHQTVKQSISVF